MKKLKKHKCKSCEKKHVEDIRQWDLGMVYYSKNNGAVHLNPFSVLDILRRSGLHEAEDELLKRIMEMLKN
jgi:hypothetical protein